MNERVRSGTIRHVRRTVVLVGWFGGLAGLLVALHGSGRGALAAPDLTAPATWSEWAAGRTPPEAAIAVLRLVGIGLGWYLLAATLLGVAAHVVGGAHTVELADVLLLPVVRRVVQVGLGVGFAGAVVAAAGAGGDLRAERVPTAADVALAVDAPTTTTTVVSPPAPPSGVDGDETPVAAPRTVVLQPGDHLWSVASRVLAAELGREPSEGEVHPYWRALVETNRSRLPHPQDPDLVYAGLEIEIPLPSAG